MLFVVVTSTIANLLLVSAQSSENPCISDLNLTTANVMDGIYTFVTPSDMRVPLGTPIHYLCCFLAGHTRSASIPRWHIEPWSNMFNLSAKVGTPLFHQRSVQYRTLKVTSTSSVNNTEIWCTASLSNGPSFKSEPRSLVVIGPPPPPVPILQITEDTVTVRWDPVFTWPEYPVTAYGTQLYRSSQKEPISPWPWSRIDDTEISIPIQQVLHFSRELQECEELTFSVWAINSLGQGEVGNVTGGLPKPNGLTMYNSTVRAYVQFNSEVQTSVQFGTLRPSLCPYQILNYTFIIEEKFNNTLSFLSISGQTIIRDAPREIIVSNVELRVGKIFTVYAILWTDNGENASTKLTTFGTITATEVCQSQESIGGIQPEIVYALGAVCAGLLIFIVLFLCGLCIRERCCCSRRKSRRPGGMIHNPIYAGPIYDSVYDSRGRLLTSNASTPSSVGTPDFPPPNSVKQLENSLMTEFDRPRQPLEPRYSTNSTDNTTADFYVKMKGKVAANGSSEGPALETVMDGELIDFVKVSDV